MGTSDLQQTITAQKNDLINKLLFVLNMLVLLAVAGSLIRYLEIGWHKVMALHLAIAAVVAVMMVLRNRIPYLYKAWIIVSMFFLAALGGLLTFGMVGGNLAIWIALPIYAAALINTRAAIALIHVTVVIYIVVAWMSFHGLLHADLDYGKIARSKSIWLSTILALPLFTYMLVLIISNLDDINRKLIESLDAQKKDLEKLNAVKDRIFSVISHDLRTPFQGLIGTLELIERDSDAFDRKDKERIFSKLLESSRGTHLMLENLLTWARSEVQESQLDARPQPLADILAEVCLPYRQVAHNKDIRIEIQVDPALCLVCDAASMKIVFSNLLSNAIKFSHPGSVINISAQQDSTGMSISILDSGVGMSAEQVEKILDANQIHTSYGTSNERGVGLGMKICLKLIKLNAGTLRVDSSPGKGSRFTIGFVLHSPHDSDRRP